MNPIATAIGVAMTAGLTAVALHETAETVRAFSPNYKHKPVHRVKDKKYEALIFGD